jgi:hypothetical protein
MAGDRQPNRRANSASRLRRVALVAVLAIASSALLPLVHGATSHTGECGVCSGIAHSGASVAEVVSRPDLPPVASSPAVAQREPVTAFSRPALDLGEARAPPAPSVSI